MRVNNFLKELLKELLVPERKIYPPVLLSSVHIGVKELMKEWKKIIIMNYRSIAYNISYGTNETLKRRIFILIYECDCFR